MSESDTCEKKKKSKKILDAKNSDTRNIQCVHSWQDKGDEYATDFRVQFVIRDRQVGLNKDLLLKWEIDQQTVNKVKLWFW